MQIRTSRKSAFTLVEIMIVVAIIGLLAAIAIPNFIKARETSQQKACISNLRQLDAAKATFALENKKAGSYPVVFSEIVGPTLYVRDMPSCPANGNYFENFVDGHTLCTVAGHTL